MVLSMNACFFVDSDRQATNSDIKARPVVGAIRWDAWHNPDKGSAAREVERSLSPKKYHWRAPFFSEILSDTAIRIKGYTQEVVDQEIEYASEMGLDYWAFLLYDEHSALSDGLNYYLDSKIKNKIKFCAMVTPSRSFGSKGTELERLVRYFKEPSYLMIAGNRPLIYFFRPTPEWVSTMGGENVVKEELGMLTKKTKEAGYGEPYIVVMHYDQTRGLQMFDLLEADALSDYAIGGDNGAEGNDYVRLMKQSEVFWDKYKESGHTLVPTIMTGWDRRPRIENPVSWELEQKQGKGMDKYFEAPTTKELIHHFMQAMEWANKKNSADQAKIVLVYAWNEHDEGGWLCPTLNEDGAINTERLEAVKKVLGN